MKLLAPEPLEASHQLDEFDCGQPALTHWLVNHARQAQGSGSARTFVTCNDTRVVGYYSLTVGQIDTFEVPERIRPGMGRYPIQLVILARPAVDLNYQKRGLGVSLLQDTITRSLTVAEHAGVRALLTHPIDAQADEFYQRFGFEPTPLQDQQLILLLKDARRFVLGFRSQTEWR